MESQENAAITVPTSRYQAGKNVDLANVLQKGRLQVSETRNGPH
jgi:hypothetical protein